MTRKSCCSKAFLKALCVRNPAIYQQSKGGWEGVRRTEKMFLIKLLMCCCQVYLSFHLQRWVVMMTEELSLYCPPGEMGLVRCIVLSE